MTRIIFSSIIFLVFLNSNSLALPQCDNYNQIKSSQNKTVCDCSETIGYFSAYWGLEKHNRNLNCDDENSSMVDNDLKEKIQKISDFSVCKHLNYRKYQGMNIPHPALNATNDEVCKMQDSDFSNFWKCEAYKRKLICDGGWSGSFSNQGRNSLENKETESSEFKKYKKKNYDYQMTCFSNNGPLGFLIKGNILFLDPKDGLPKIYFKVDNKILKKNGNKPEYILNYSNLEWYINFLTKRVVVAGVEYDYCQ